MFLRVARYSGSPTPHRGGGEVSEQSEARDGLRSLKVITRDIPTIELESVLQKAGWLVEYTGGIMLVTRPR
jgi:hypothetical protein